MPRSPPLEEPETDSGRFVASGGSAPASSARRCCRGSSCRTLRSSTCSTRFRRTSISDLRSARLVRHGLRIQVVPDRPGSRLDRDAAADTIVRALGQLERPSGAVALPVEMTPPAVTAEMLAAPAERARLAISRAVIVRAAGRSFRIPRWRLAQLLSLPSGPGTQLTIGGRCGGHVLPHPHEHGRSAGSRCRVRRGRRDRSGSCRRRTGSS